MRFPQPPSRNQDDEPMREADPAREAEPVEDEAEGSAKREGEYLRHLAEEKTPVVIQLVTGESFRGHIEYYDRRFIRLTRQGAPNLFIFKQDIKYLYEE